VVVLHVSQDFNEVVQQIAERRHHEGARKTDRCWATIAGPCWLQIAFLDYKNPGLQWLSWSSIDRSNFVYGYIEGYGEGMNRACLSANDLFDKDKPRVPGHDDVPSTFPSARSRASVDQFSSLKVDVSKGPDYSPYTDVITAFYTQHPEYRNVPFVYLMQFLTDKEHKSADDLYSMAKSGKLSTSW
jgi:hypothetical protein